MKEENKLYNVKIRVLHYWSGHVYGPSAPQVTVLIARDEQKTKMQLAIPELLASKWSNSFTEGSMYKITDAMLCRLEKKTRLVNNDFQLYLTEATTVEQISDAYIDLEPLCEPKELKEIPKMMENPDQLQDIMAVVVDMRPPVTRITKTRSLKFVEVYITDATIWPECALITVWEDAMLRYQSLFNDTFEQQFLLIGVALKPKSYKDKYGLQTTGFTKFTSDPLHVPEENQVCQSLMQVVAQHQLHVPRLSEFSEVFCSTEKQLTLITHLISAARPFPTNDISCTIRGTITEIHYEAPILYRCCVTCSKSMYNQNPANPGCPNPLCSNKEGNSIERYKVKINVKDSTGTATLTLFDSDAQEIFRVPASEITTIKMQEAGNQKIIRILESALNKTYDFHIKVTRSNHRYIDFNGYTVQAIDWVPQAFNTALTAPNPVEHTAAQGSATESATSSTASDETTNSASTADSEDPPEKQP